MSTRAERMKAIEHEYCSFVDPGTYVVARMDGKAFHTWTKMLDRPYDERMSAAMISATRYAAMRSGAPIVFAYTQSDEISVVVNNTGAKRQPWYGGSIAKMVSVLASTVTARFNAELGDEDLPLAIFDARVAMSTTDPAEVADYLAWRYYDAVKNSVSMLAHHHFANAQLAGASQDRRIEMLTEAGHDWGVECPEFNKAGAFIIPVTHEVRDEDGQVIAERTRWDAVSAWSTPISEALDLDRTKE